MKKYRLEFVPNMDTQNNKVFTVENDSLIDLRLIADNLANYTLFLHDKYMMQDYSNMMVILENIGGEWYMIEDEEDEN